MADVTRALAGDPGAGVPAVARITHQAGKDDGWVELLASGLTFDLLGLAPGKPQSAPRLEHVYGIADAGSLAGCPAVVLAPGPHLRSGAAMMPVLRVMAGIAARLATATRTQAVCWPAAATCLEPHYFDRVVEAWLGGGAFPALGLTAIVRGEDGMAESRGLGFFTGQELQVEPRDGEPFADTAKLAARIIGDLVESGRLEHDTELVAPDGAVLRAALSANRRLVRVSRPQ